MDEGSGPIYGLELQARALAPQLGEGNEICFFIGTNSLKPTNQVHLIEFNDEQSVFKTKIFEHSLGEIWKISSCPQDKQTISTCFSVQNVAQVQTQAALLTLPFEEEEQTSNTEYLQWKRIEILDTEQYGDKVKCLEFHPSLQRTLACVVNGKVVIFDRAESKTRMVTDVMASNPNAKNIPPFTTGKWSPHHQGQQFIVLHECAVRCYDIRDTRHAAWQIDNAHTQLARDLDCNPNKQCHLVTGGDDGYIKVWDSRMAKDPLIKRNDHAHWIWSVRFNTFHDQLILSSSSDCKVNLTCAGSVSSENGSPVLEYKETAMNNQTAAASEERRRILSDGLLQTFDQHEDSVYAAEWSNVDPWVFASLSYDGRLLISKVPKQFKYEIMF